jgi:hypothetical protein
MSTLGPDPARRPRVVLAPEGEAGLPGAEQVDLQRLSDDLEVGGGCLLPGVVVDGGVVDQDIQAAVAAIEVGGDLLDPGRVGDIQAPGQHAFPGWQRGGGPFGLAELRNAALGGLVIGA